MASESRDGTGRAVGGAADGASTATGGGSVVGEVTRGPAAGEPGFVVGQRVAGRYTIVRFLGRGGMGEVYEAEDEELHGRIAVKVLRGDRFDDERGAAILRRELATARRVTHPGVCRVFDVKDHDGVSLYTMELLDGETLADRVRRRGPLPLAEVLPIVEQLCAGLAAAHAAGIVHRDFKPHNVMLCGERAVITDFGLALALEAGDPTRSMELAGTPAYMAPEQLTGGKVTVAVDVYALGVTMFELVTGERPFAAATPLATALVRVHAAAPPARTRVADLDPRWDDVIARCLARAPEQRPTLAEVVAGLTAARRARPRRRAVARAVLALVVVVAAASAVVAATRRGGDDRPRSTPLVAERFATGAVARLIRLSGPGREKIETAARDVDGNLYLGGHGTSGAHLGAVGLTSTAGSWIAVVTRIDPDGRVGWTRSFTATTKVSIAAVAVDGSGNVFVVGHCDRGELDLGDRSRPVTGSAQGFVVALSARDGSTRWLRLLTGPGESSLRGGGVGPDGNLYVVGDQSGGTDFGDGVRREGTGPSPFVGSYAPDGAVRWVVWGRSGDNARGRVLAFDDGAVLAGGSVAGEVELAGARWTTGVIRAAFAISIDLRSGRPRWVRWFRGGSELWAIVRTSRGRLLVAGGFVEEFEPMPGLVLRPPAQHNRPWIAAVDPATGTPTWAAEVGLGQPASWGVRMLAPLPDGRVVAGGGFDGALAAAAQTTATSGEMDGYLAIVDDDGAIAATAVVPGPGSERLKGIALIAPGVLAAWGRHEGASFGAVALGSEGLADGFYAELRLADLFP